MKRFQVFLAIGLLVVPLVASAAEIRVSYLLETRPFKAAVAGTPLTLSLYTDSACAGSPTATAVVNSEALALIEPLKRTKVQGGAKPPATSRVEHVMTGVTASPLFYLTVTGTGVVPVGGACQVQRATVNGSDAVLPAPPSPVTCAPDAVRAGPGQPCVDKYEASLWQIPPGNTALIQKVKDGTATLADLTGGGATQWFLNNSPPGNDCMMIWGYFPYDGHFLEPLYAASVAGVKPSVCVTAYQAAVACRLSNKRLLTEAEFMAAGAGTIDTDVDDCSTDCNTNSYPGGCVIAPTDTGSRSACVSTAGTFDQIGNVFEWTLNPTNDVLTGAPTAVTAFYGGGWYWGASSAVSWGNTMPADFSEEDIGFRCGR